MLEVHSKITTSIAEMKIRIVAAPIAKVPSQMPDLTWDYVAVFLIIVKEWSDKKVFNFKFKLIFYLFIILFLSLRLMCSEFEDTLEEREKREYNYTSVGFSQKLFFWFNTLFGGFVSLNFHFILMIFCFIFCVSAITSFLFSFVLLLIINFPFSIFIHIGRAHV